MSPPAAVPPDRDPRPKCSPWKKAAPLPTRPLYLTRLLLTRPAKPPFSPALLTPRPC